MGVSQMTKAALAGLCSVAMLSGLTAVPVSAQGRAEDVVYYGGIAYDGACLYRLAQNLRHLSDADYLEEMNAQCLWGGVENPSSPGIPKGSTFSCDSVPCVRSFNGTRIP